METVDTKKQDLAKNQYDRERLKRGGDMVLREQKIRQALLNVQANWIQRIAQATNRSNDEKGRIESISLAIDASLKNRDRIRQLAIKQVNHGNTWTTQQAEQVSRVIDWRQQEQPIFTGRGNDPEENRVGDILAALNVIRPGDVSTFLKSELWTGGWQFDYSEAAPGTDRKLVPRTKDFPMDDFVATVRRHPNGETDISISPFHDFQMDVNRHEPTSDRRVDFTYAVGLNVGVRDTVLMDQIKPHHVMAGLVQPFPSPAGK